MKPIIIIGSGMAGISVAREFRKLDGSTPLMLISADSGGFYAKPMLSNALAQRKSAAQLRNQNASQVAEQVNATVMANTVVHSIDASSKTLHTELGDFEYEKLVLATGAQPIRLPIAGDAADQMISINHIDDYSRFRDAILHKQESSGAEKLSIAIIGAGLIGCEFADDLAGAGFAIHVIDPNALPLAALVPSPISVALQAALEKRGVQLHLQTTTASINHSQESTDHALQINLANDEQFGCDLVLSAVGLRPDLRLAQQTLPGAIHTDRGILVNQFGQTNHSDIYALGDCAQYQLADGSRPTLPYIAPIMHAARAIAKSLAGDVSAIDFPLMPVLVKTPSLPIALIAPPIDKLKHGEWHHESQGNGTLVSRFFDTDKNLIGFALAPQETPLRNQLCAEMQQKNS